MVLAVNAWNEPKKRVAEFVKDKRTRQRILLDGKDVAGTYGILGVPTLFWINGQGVVVDAEVGFHGPASLERKTRKLLSGG